MDLFSNIVLTIMTVAIICGVILISIPLFKIQNYFKRSNRPYFSINKKKKDQYVLKNTGNSEAKINHVFLEDNIAYFEDLNGISFAPNQKISFKLPVKELNSDIIEINYFDTLSQKDYSQKFSLNNI